MDKLKSILFVTIILFSFTLALNAQKAVSTSYSKIIEDYKASIKEKMQKNHIVGAGAALILGDSIIWKEGFGYADKENKIPFTTQTALCIGSITKPFTGMGIMQLHEKGLLDVDKPLVNYLPEFSIKTRKTDIKEITVKSVLQHTSGIPNDIFLNVWDEKENYTNVVDYLKNEYLCFPVNMVFHYSNLGYSLLGHTILKVSRQPYPNYIQDNILKPIGMNNSGFVGYHALKNVSKTYDSSGTYFPIKYGRNIPAGGLLSTIDDMIKLAQELIAIYNGKRGGFIKPETLRLFDEINKGDVQIGSVCFGWGVASNDSNIIISHAGSHHVAVAEITINLKKKIAAVLLVNTEGGLELTGYEKVWELSGMTSANQAPSFLYKKNTSNNISADSLKGHAGIYVDTRSNHIVKFENNMLMLNSVYGNFQLKPQTNNEFLPGKIIKPDSIKWLTKSRFIFAELKGYNVLFYQGANNNPQPLGYLVNTKEINGIWKNRLGKYKLEGKEFESLEKFSEAELSIADNNLLQLKVFYTSGEYLYYLRIENENELIFCGFDTHGGETISFSKNGQNDLMRLYGLTMKKSN